MGSSGKIPAAVAACGLFLATGCAVSEEETKALDQARQDYVDSVNGLNALNGLNPLNGLNALNGLNPLNGLTPDQGINGLSTVDGESASNGLSVDCTNNDVGTSCTGEPDGLLSASTGMMSSDDGIATAKYLVRCALARGDSVRIKDYTGALITLGGEMGLAAEWKTGSCDQGCQERVSACLMALTNASGEHVTIELSSHAPSIGPGHSLGFPYQEAVFYGNVFTSPPQANYCVGKNAVGYTSWVDLFFTLRLCEPYDITGTLCPYKRTGACNFDITNPMNSNKCRFSSGAATQCKDAVGKVWYNPITTYLEESPFWSLLER